MPEKRKTSMSKCPYCGIPIKKGEEKCSKCSKYSANNIQNPKTSRNTKIIEMLESGDYTLEEVGEEFGISRQRVHQIYKSKTGKNYRKRIKKNRKKRVKEKMEKRRSLKTLNKYCMGCGRLLKKEWLKKYREKQNKNKGVSRKYCPKCRRISQSRRDPKITFTCAYCGDEFHPFYNWMLTPGTPKFCSRECYYDSMKVERSSKKSYETLPVFSKL